MVHVAHYQKTNNLTKKRVEALNRHFSKEDTQRAKKHLKRCAMLIIREMQVKATMRYHLTPVRMAIIKKSTNREYGKKGTVLYCR